MTILLVVFNVKLDCVFEEYFLKAHEVCVLVGQKLLNFFIISPDSSAVRLYEGFIMLFGCIDFSMVDLRLIELDSSVSILS